MQHNNEDEYIALSRTILNWEWYSDINVRMVFIHLLLKANQKSKSWCGIVIERGQLVTSVNESLPGETGLSVMKIRTALSKLIQTGYITNKTTNKYSLITITNFNYWINNNKQITNEHQEETKQNNNNSQVITAAYTEFSTQINKQITNNGNIDLGVKNDQQTNNKQITNKYNLNNPEITNSNNQMPFDKKQETNKQITTTTEYNTNSVEENLDLIKEIKSKKNKKEILEPKEFKNFWDDEYFKLLLYGRIGNRKNALEAFLKIKNPNYAEIIAGVRRYADYLAAKRTLSPAHASTWLNGRRWEDPDTTEKIIIQQKPLEAEELMVQKLGQANFFRKINKYDINAKKLLENWERRSGKQVTWDNIQQWHNQGKPKVIYETVSTTTVIESDVICH